MKYLSHSRVPKAIVEFSKRYFQVEVNGLDNVPLFPQNSMLVMNHTAFFALEVYLIAAQILNRDPEQRLNTLVWEGFTDGPMGPYFKSFGCKAAKISTGAELLKDNKTILIMPEGVGATDVTNRFNTFHTGFLRMVKEHPVPIIPIGFYGCDQSIPWLVSHNKFLIDTFMKPIDPDFDFFILPKIPIFRPTKIVFNVGKPINLTKKDLSSEARIQAQTQAVQAKIERLVDSAQNYRNARIDESKLNKLYHRVVQGHVTNL